MAPLGTGPADEGSWDIDAEEETMFGGVRRFVGGGAPCRERWKAFILSCMDCGRLPPLEDRDGGGPGLRAALTAPRGVEEAVMFADIVPSVGVRKVGSLGGGLEDDLALSGEAEDRMEAAELGSEGRLAGGASGGELMSAMRIGEGRAEDM